jgi:hypothetical protein
VAVTGLFERALGEEWDELHPELRARYSLTSDEDASLLGSGRIDLSRSLLAYPVLWLGTAEDFLFPEDGFDVPFTIRTDAFVDGEGYEALTFRRHFDTEPRREFVDTFRWNPERECVTNLFGTEGRVVADLYPTVEDGALRLEVGDQWLRLWDYVPLPEPLWVDAVARDWYDEGAGRHRIGATISNPLAGHVFGYQGVFDLEREPASDERPSHPSMRSVDLPREDR